MKNGFFRFLSALLMSLSLAQLTGCASLLDFSEEDPSEYDRGYQAHSQYDCDGGFCDTEAGDIEERSPASIRRAPVEDARLDVRRAIETRDVVLGMSRQDVVQSWGEPVQREVAGNGTAGHERWTYGSRYSFSQPRTVIFQNGRVAGWHR